ncbi:MAG: GYD domain-containing protein, partial [Candidatus Rokubacteria bacterium]|nr:GYD domain-containing protein [Candidatus Rokubacteria bacterium]
EAPSDDVMARFVLALSSAGNVRTTTTLKAFPEAEYRKIIQGLP